MHAERSQQPIIYSSKDHPESTAAIQGCATNSKAKGSNSSYSKDFASIATKDTSPKRYGAPGLAALKLILTVKTAGPPERILIYHGGTGSTIFLGMLRVSTIFLFGISCVVVAPAFFAADYPSYVAPASEFSGFFVRV